MDQKDPHEEAKSAKAGGAKLKGLKVINPWSPVAVYN